MYGVSEWKDAEDFIKQLAALTGKLLKGGEPDINNVSKTMIMDWQRGKIPFFEYPPKSEEEEEQAGEEEAKKEEDKKEEDKKEEDKKEEEQ